MHQHNYKEKFEHIKNLFSVQRRNRMKHSLDEPNIQCRWVCLNDISFSKYFTKIKFSTCTYIKDVTKRQPTENVVKMSHPQECRSVVFSKGRCTDRCKQKSLLLLLQFSSVNQRGLSSTTYNTVKHTLIIRRAYSRKWTSRKDRILEFFMLSSSFSRLSPHSIRHCHHWVHFALLQQDPTLN